MVREEEGVRGKTVAGLMKQKGIVWKVRKRKRNNELEGLSLRKGPAREGGVEKERILENWNEKPTNAFPTTSQA